MAGSTICPCELKLLRVNRSASYRNSLQEEFRDIQLTCKVRSAESCKARCTAIAVGPPEVKIATRFPRRPAERNFAKPEFTREQNSSQVSTPSGAISPCTHFPMTASNNF